MAYRIKIYKNTHLPISIKFAKFAVVKLQYAF